VRFGGVSLFLIIELVVNHLLPHSRPPAFPAVLLVYWLLSSILFAGARQSTWVARWSALAVPFFDMPAVFLAQWLDFESSTDPRALADFTLSLFVLLVMLSALTLKTRQVVLAGCVAVGLQLTLQHKAEDSSIGQAAGVAVLIVAVTLCSYALARRIQMLHVLAGEVLHRERLGRYFSPQVAAHIEHTSLGLAAGQQCEVTVLFADLRQFTTLSAEINLPTPPTPGVAGWPRRPSRGWRRARRARDAAPCPAPRGCRTPRRHGAAVLPRSRPRRSETPVGARRSLPLGGSGKRPPPAPSRRSAVCPG
jgi:adenylate cyclase